MVSGAGAAGGVEPGAAAAPVRGAARRGGAGRGLRAGPIVCAGPGSGRAWHALRLSGERSRLAAQGGCAGRERRRRRRRLGTGRLRQGRGRGERGGRRGGGVRCGEGGGSEGEGGGGLVGEGRTGEVGSESRGVAVDGVMGGFWGGGGEERPGRWWEGLRGGDEVMEGGQAFNVKR